MRYNGRTRRTARLSLWTATLLFAVLPLGCDSDPAGPGDDDDQAVVTGSVAPASSQQASSAMGTAASANEASTVVIGEVDGSGSFHALASGEVDGSGHFRIEGVPTGRVDLVVSARSEGETEVGRVVLHEETRAGAEHRTHPIDANSTLHARVWTQLRASGGSDDRMSSAELALFVHADGAAAAQTAASEAQVAAFAQGALEAQTAMSGILEARGYGSLDASARADLLQELVVQRDRDRAEGASPGTTQDTYAEAALSAMLDAGADAEALALAYAAAATGLDRAMAEADAEARLDVARQAILLNLAARSEAAAQASGDGLGLQAEVVAALGDAEASVRSAASVAELHQGLENARGNMQSRVVARFTSELNGVPLELLTHLESELELLLESARLWTSMEGVASAEAMVQAAAQFRGEVEAAVTAFMAELPEDVQADVSAEVLVDLLVALGAGAHGH